MIEGGEADAKRAKTEAQTVDAFRAARSSLEEPSHTMPFLWESNAWLKCTMSGSDHLAFMNDPISAMFTRPALEPFLRVAEVAPEVRVVRALSQFQKAIIKFRKCRPVVAVTEDGMREKAIGRWKDLIDIEPEAFVVGRQCLEETMLRLSVGASLSVLEDVLISKATGTLMSRSGPLLKYCKWCKTKSITPWPIKESVTYLYLNNMRASKCAPTAPGAFLSSLGFSMEMLGLDGAREAYNSKRLQGLCFGEFLKKRRLLQRRPLTVPDVCRVEDIVMDERNLVDSVMAGFFLVMISLRARFSDTHEITDCTQDLVVDSEGRLRGFVDAPIARTKTGRSKEKRRILLPLCGSSIGLKHEDWLGTWLKLKDEAGINGRFMTAPDSFVGFGTRRLENREANAWLRHLLSMDVECCDIGLVGTHSCKATQLSWAAKEGLEPSCRRLLGYHSSGKDQ